MKYEKWLEIVPVEVVILLRKLEAEGFETWLVGGCVRDMILGIIPSDYDVATAALPAEVKQVFPRSVDTGVRHGTITVLLGQLQVEVTTFRSEGPYSDGRRPDHISYENTLLPDLSRRDFTVNSMAWHPDRGLKDPFGGLNDLQGQVLRCVGNAYDRLTEDALRQLRAIRFSLTYNLKPDEELREAIRACNTKIKYLSLERIFAELMRLIRAPYAHALNNFSGLGLIAAVIKHVLNLSVNDQDLCASLSCFIQPFWSKEQIWPVIQLSVLMAQKGRRPLDTQQNMLPDSFDLSSWLDISHHLTTKRLTELSAYLVRHARLPVHLAITSQAILIIIGLKLFFFESDQRSARQSACAFKANEEKTRKLRRLYLICRHVNRFVRAEADQLSSLVEMACGLLLALTSDFVLRGLLREDLELIADCKQSMNLPDFTVRGLPVKGSDEAFDCLTDKRKTGLYLERLLSRKLLSNRPQEQNTTEAAYFRKLLNSWL